MLSVTLEMDMLLRKKRTLEGVYEMSEAYKRSLLPLLVQCAGIDHNFF